MVAINLTLRREARVEFRRHLPERGQLNRLGQTGLQRHAQFVGAVLPRRVEMKNLRPGVHPGIGAPAALNADFLSEGFRQLPLDQVLDGVAALLALEAVEVRAVVGTGAFPTGD